MEGFIKGDIVVINFPFTDYSAVKRRPALVVSDLDGNDIILCQITSRAKTDKYSIAIKADDYKNGKLSVDSVIRPNKIFTADKKLILYTACGINEDLINNVTGKIIEIINPK